MHVPPAERDLQNLMKVGDRTIGTHQQAPPNERADATEHRTQLINVIARLRLGRHCRILQGVAASLHPQDPDALVADGTHFNTYEDNLLAEHHIRYGKTGGIAYRHIADNYIALFSRFIACGTYEATYILDALLHNLLDLKPKRVHADTHGQSSAVFGLAYLMGIELMPRIRRWRQLRLCRAREPLSPHQWPIQRQRQLGAHS